MAFSQTITVTDKETGMPVEMATLVSTGSNIFAVTDEKGQTDVTAFRGSERIEIRMLGYKTENLSFSELEKRDFALQLHRSGISIDQYVVSATRWNQSSRDVPARIATISASEFSLQNPQTAADLLGVSGDVYIQKSQQGGGSPMIRGFATNRLLYTVDGIRMNTAIFRSGNLQNVISLDPFATEHVEVFFGPGSVIYGSDAIGGVMSFHTLNATLSKTDQPVVKGNAIARYSSANDEMTAHFDVGVGGKKWSSVTSFSSFNYGDLRMGSHGPRDYLRYTYVERHNDQDVVVTNPDPQVQTPSGYSQINLMQKIGFKASRKWDFKYGFHLSETSSYARYDRHLREKNGLPRYGEWDYGPQKWMMNHFQINHSDTTQLYEEVSLNLAWQSFGESRIDRSFNSPNRSIREENVEAYSVNLDFLKSAGKKLKLFYGVEAVLNEVRSTGLDENIVTGSIHRGPSRYPNSTWESYGAYLSTQYKMNDKWLFQAGMRYNTFRLHADFDTLFYPLPFTEAKIENDAITGSAGVVYRPNDKWVFSLNASTGFRSPNVDDIGKIFDSEPGSVVVPNPDLNAEYAYNAEAGIVKVFGKSVKIDMSFYYTLLEDAMVRRDFQLNGMDSIMYSGNLSQVQAVQNAASATVYGAQAGLEIKLPHDFSISSDFNYQIGEEELEDGTKSPSRHAPPWFGITRLTYSYGDLDLQVNAVYTGERKFEDMPFEEAGKEEIYAKDSQGNPYAPSWYTLNLKSDYKISDHLVVSAGLENILDKRYRPYSSGISAPGRNFVMSVRVKF